MQKVIQIVGIFFAATKQGFQSLLPLLGSEFGAFNNDIDLDPVGDIGGLGKLDH